MTWQPIETAPVDGSTVLLFSPDAAEPQIMLGFWTEWEGDDLPPNWTDAWTVQEIDARPTHWMPLPELPA